MNLVVVRPDGTVYARPDTTLVRGARDFYLPDDFSFVDARPCRWIRILKSAKAVQERFAQRYFDAVGSGWLLYGDGTDPLLDASTYIFDPAPNGLRAAGTSDPDGTPNRQNRGCSTRPAHPFMPDSDRASLAASPTGSDRVPLDSAPSGSGYPLGGTAVGESSALPDIASPCAAPNGSEHPAVGTIVGESSSLPDVSSPFYPSLANVTRHLLLHQGDLLILESPESTILRRGDTHPTASFRIL